MEGDRYTSHLSRNEFVKLVTMILGSIIGFVLGLPGIVFLISPGIRQQEPKAWISLGPLENYPVGIPTKFSFVRTQVNGWDKTALSYGVYVLHKSEDQVVVFSDICTHLGCRVKWHTDIQEYVSPCHDGHFDMDGYVTKGPPPRPLDQFETKVEDGNLHIYMHSS